MSDRAFTARLPDLEYSALKSLAYFTGKPMTHYLVRGVRLVLAEHAGKGIASVVDEAGSRFLAALDGIDGES